MKLTKLTQMSHLSVITVIGLCAASGYSQVPALDPAFPPHSNETMETPVAKHSYEINEEHQEKYTERALAQVFDNRSEVDQDSAQLTRKNIAIMAKVLDKLLQIELSDHYQKAGFFNKGVEGIWLPGTGVLFQMQVNFPLDVKQDPEDENGNTDKEEPTDLWEQVEKQLNGKNEAQEIFPDRYSPDSNALNIIRTTKLQRVIARLIAKYGTKLEGFPEDEKIIIHVQSPVQYVADHYYGDTQWGIYTGIPLEDLKQTQDLLQKQMSELQEKKKKEIEEHQKHSQKKTDFPGESDQKKHEQSPPKTQNATPPSSDDIFLEPAFVLKTNTVDTGMHVLGTPNAGRFSPDLYRKTMVMQIPFRAIYQHDLLFEYIDDTPEEEIMQHKELYFFQQMHITVY